MLRMFHPKQGAAVVPHNFAIGENVMVKRVAKRVTNTEVLRLVDRFSKKARVHAVALLGSATPSLSASATTSRTRHLGMRSGLFFHDDTVEGDKPSSLATLTVPPSASIV